MKQERRREEKRRPLSFDCWHYLRLRGGQGVCRSTSTSYTICTGASCISWSFLLYHKAHRIANRVAYFSEINRPMCSEPSFKWDWKMEITNSTAWQQLRFVGERSIKFLTIATSYYLSFTSRNKMAQIYYLWYEMIFDTLYYISYLKSI